MARRRKKRKDRRETPVGEGEPALKGIALLLSEAAAASLDLHGFTADQARARLGDFLRTQATLNPGKVVHVVTGRGNRSEGAPVLPGVVREELDGAGAGFVREYAGLPGGGGVAVRVR